jgi:hypothetical protein
MYTHANSMPDGASRIAHRAVNADAERKLRTLENIALETVIVAGQVVDEIAQCIGESNVLYVRPMASLLINMGVIRKGPLKIASVCGRAAHTLEPSPDLIMELWRSDYDGVAEARAIVRAFIVERMAESRRAERTNRGGARA